MAPIKQPARKSTGGKAPRQLLSTKTSRSAARLASDASSDDESVAYLATSSPGVKKHDAFGYDKWPFGGKGKPRTDENSGEFSFGGQAETLPAVPRLEVKGVGPISVPLRSEQAQKLVDKCDNSPFGRKLDTLMDENVRKSWQLAPDQVDIKNPLWHSGMDKLSDVIAGRLGYRGVPMQCKLYKLLVYGEGGHFVKHQDTEKEDGMVATLVVQLPSLHEGGDLVVYRGGKEVQRHDFGKKDGTAAYLPHYAVHYADAEHALEKVTSGYRLVLVYSICLPPAMQHLMIRPNEALVEELETAINAMDDKEDDSFALLLAHEYTGKSVEDLGSGALKGIDRARFLMLREANSLAPADKKLQFFIAQLKHEIKYYDDGGSWAETSRDESITWYNINGEKLKRSTRTKLQLNFLNPGQETMSELWTPHGNSTFEGYLGSEGATKDTTYSRCAVVAWPATKGVEKAFKFIGVNAAVEALQIQKPTDAATVRQFMEDVKTKLAAKDSSNSWLEKEAVSVGFCRILCDVLVEVDDSSLVNHFFNVFIGNLDDYKKNIELAAAFTTLANKIDDNSDNDLIYGSDLDDEVAEETDDSRMAIALKISDGLETGPAQQALLHFAAEKASRLAEKHLCSSKSIGLLWKWAIRCDDRIIFDTVSNKFSQTKPELLQPVIDAFSQHLGSSGASADKITVLEPIAARRIEWLKNQLKSLGQPFSWTMPDAVFSDNSRVQAFLRSPKSSMDTRGVRSFYGVSHSRNYAAKWMREKQINASFTLEAIGRGQDAYVKITKTRSWFSDHQKKLKEYKTEVNILSSRFGGAGARKRARHE